MQKPTTINHLMDLNRLLASKLAELEALIADDDTYFKCECCNTMRHSRDYSAGSDTCVHCIDEGAKEHFVED